jgi:hypothetical protein
VFIEYMQQAGNTGGVQRAGEKGAVVVFQAMMLSGNMRMQDYLARAKTETRTRSHSIRSRYFLHIKYVRLYIVCKIKCDHYTTDGSRSNCAVQRAFEQARRIS